MKTELLGCGLTVEGQLGVRMSDPMVTIPDRIIGAPSGADGSIVKSVACGENHTIFLAADGKMWSVGGNEDGQLGRGNRNQGSYSIYPVSSTSGSEIIQVAAGRAHSLAVCEDGRVFAWGSNAHGQLGMPSSVQWQELPKRIKSLTEVVQVSSGSDHCIALTESGRVLVWGEQADGQCLHEPDEITQLHGIPITRVIAGGRHCIAISASGVVYSWGQNDCGQLASDDLRPMRSVHHVKQVDGMGVIEAACGDKHTVLLTSGGRIFVVGSDTAGQCGFGKKIEKRTTPAVVGDLMGSYVTRIAAGRCHTIALVGGAVYPFGLNSSGQLGNGSLRTLSTPRRTDDLDHVQSAFAGWDQTFFLRSTHPTEATPGPNSPIKYPQVIRKGQIEKLIEEGNKMDVITLIESVFSSLSSINGSFLLEDERRFHVSGERGHGVDLDAAMDAFVALEESTSDDQYAELIREMISMSLFEIESSNFPSIECLRVYLILPWLSSFTKHVTEQVINKLHQPFAKSIGHLSEKNMNILELWWGQLPSRHFKRIVKAMTSAVRCVAVTKKNVNYSAKYALLYLSVLHRLNIINKAHHIIPPDAFYVDEINDSVDLQRDYIVWANPMGPSRAQMGIPADAKFWSAFPFIMNAAAKEVLLNVEAAMVQHIRVENATVHTLFGSFYTEIPNLEIHVRRDSIVSDTMNRINSLSPNDLQKPLKVKIHGEEADDAGGVRKEFFMIVLQKILQPEYGMFAEDETSHLVWFSGLPPPFCEREQFRQLGRLCGLAVYNKVIVAFPFPLALYKMLLNEPPTIEDLCELSPIEGKGLQALLDYEGDDVEDVFGLNFCVTVDLMGETKTVNLMQNGESVAVTNQNRQQYVELYVRQRLELGVNNEILKQAQMFKSGFNDAVHSRVMSLFQPRELMELVVGNENYDWYKFRDVVEYKEEYHAKHPTILAFWEAFYQLDEDERKKFLQFLCGSSRLPLAGMSALHVTIQPTAPEMLPVAHTCFNLLDLPRITNAQELLRRLRISIQHTQGFTLV